MAIFNICESLKRFLLLREYSRTFNKCLPCKFGGQPSANQHSVHLKFLQKPTKKPFNTWVRGAIRGSQRWGTTSCPSAQRPSPVPSETYKKTIYQLGQGRYRRSRRGEGVLLCISIASISNSLKKTLNITNQISQKRELVEFSEIRLGAIEVLYYIFYYIWFSMR